MSEMTLEQVRDELRNSVSLVHKPSFSRLDEFADAIDAHLTRAPVQVADSIARHVAECLQFHGWATGGDFEDDFLPDVRRAIESARLAQPVVAKVPEELPRNGVTVREHEYNAGWNDCREVMLSHMNESQPHSQAAQGGEAQGKVVERAAEIIDILSSQRQSHGAQEES